MMVRMQNRGRDIIGLFIGDGNVRRYFPASITTIELELDHLRIQCELKPSFWCDQAEITDSRLCAWLSAKAHSQPGLRLARLAMFRTGGSSFRLEASPLDAKTGPKLSVSSVQIHLRASRSA